MQGERFLWTLKMYPLMDGGDRGQMRPHPRPTVLAPGDVVLERRK